MREREREKERRIDKYIEIKEMKEKEKYICRQRKNKKETGNDIVLLYDVKVCIQMFRLTLH